MKNNIYKIFALMITFGVLFISCDGLTTPDVDDESIQDNALGERAVGDVFGMVNTGTGSGKATGDCGDFDYNPLTKLLTITFDGSTCNDGVVRSGVISAQFAGTWMLPSSTVEITFQNYKRDGKTLSGTINVNYVSGGAQPVFTLTATNMKLEFSDGKQLIWESSNTYTWIEGAATLLDRSDDSYSISGTTTGTARNGKEFSRVATDLVTSPTCKWFVSGNLLLTITDGDKEDVYNMTFSTPCGTVTIVYNGLSFTRNFES